MNWNQQFQGNSYGTNSNPFNTNHQPPAANGTFGQSAPTTTFGAIPVMPVGSSAKPKKQPLYWLFISFILSLLALGVDFYFERTLKVAVSSWGVGVLAVTFICVYLIHDAKNSASTGYIRTSMGKLVFSIVVLVALAIIVILSILLGLVVGRL